MGERSDFFARGCVKVYSEWFQPVGHCNKYQNHFSLPLCLYVCVLKFIWGVRRAGPAWINWVSKLLRVRSEFFGFCLQLRRRKGQQKRRKRKNARGCFHLQGNSPCLTQLRLYHTKTRFMQFHSCRLQAVEVMMFGMTGAGKSALGNLIAGQNIFDSGPLTPDIKHGWHSCEGALLTNSLKTEGNAVDYD